MLTDAVVDTFVVSAENDDVFLEAQFVGNALVEHFAVRRHVYYLVVFTFGTEFLYHLEHRLDHHDHACVSAVAVVIHVLAWPYSVLAQVMDMNLDQTFLYSPAHYRMTERAVKQFRYDCKNIYSHKLVPTSNVLQRYAFFYIFRLFAELSKSAIFVGHTLFKNKNKFMSEVIIPEEQALPSDVVEKAVETVEEQSAQAPEQQMNLADKTLAELVGLFQELGEGVERLKKSKEVEAIKSAFYKRLSKEKSDAGLAAAVSEPDEDSPAEAEQPAEDVKMNPFEAIEAGFKSLYNEYKKERAELNRQQEAEREENLSKKRAIIEALRQLVEKQEDVNATFPEFREIQNRWRETGPVPAQQFRDVNDQYQFLVEKFYDMVKINRDLRDLDFKKNLEAKESFVAAAEKLAENENVIEAFRELQKLHEQWKEFGPVAKEKREEIWDRFKAATSVINKKYQAYFEGQKAKQAENLEAKSAICEKVEAIADKEISSSNEWNTLSKEIEELQKQWKEIGTVPKKYSDDIWARFNAACDAFFAAKKEATAGQRTEQLENMDKKKSIIERLAEIDPKDMESELRDRLRAAQEEWNQIGHVPFKEKDKLYKLFREQMDRLYGAASANATRRRINRFKSEIAEDGGRMRERLVRQLDILRNEIKTYENNLGFLNLSSKSKSGSNLIEELNRKVDKLKADLEEVKAKIAAIDEKAE